MKEFICAIGLSVAMAFGIFGLVAFLTTRRKCVICKEATWWSRWDIPFCSQHLKQFQKLGYDEQLRIYFKDIIETLKQTTTN